VARGTQHRKRRPAQDARAAAVAAPRKQKKKQPEWQDQLFFNRIRTHAKWAYVGLVAAFVIGFVLLGVGSGSNGLSDAFQSAFNFGSSGGTSIGKLEDKVAKHPQDAAAWRDLATAYEQKHQTQDAVNALERYTALRPKDADGYSELASQYTTLARDAATDYQNAQNDATLASPTTAFAPASTTVFGKIFNDPKALQDPIGNLLQTQASSKAQTALSSYQSASQQAEATFKKLAKLTPNDVTVQYQLGQAAQAASDFPTAIAAYKKFLQLAPNDVDAPSVRQLLKQVRAQAGITATTTGSG
jgi:cytochrome c-type biogenesis protein CcmH/NrfG